MTTTAYEIPLTPEPQTFVVELPTGAVTMTLRYNEWAPCWQLSIERDGAMILEGLAVVPGVDILGQHAHLELGGKLEVQKSGDLLADVGYGDLGTAAKLYFLVETP